MKPFVAKQPGLRSRKASQTRERIAGAAIRLFLKDGFDETTLDSIADAADISRRTFFHYFSSKEGILEAVDDSVHEAFRASLSEHARQTPVEAVKSALLHMIGRYESDEAKALDRLLRSTEALRARKQANYAKQEKMLFDVLCEMWPDPTRRPALQVVAMASIGAMRVATERWRDCPETQSLTAHLEQAFSNLTAELKG